jgi:Flp pilus assembly protein CpaB
MAVRLVLQFAETGDGGTVRRSNQLVLAGIAFFVVGVVIVLIVGRDNGSSSSSSSGGNQTVSVLVAKEALTPGTKGADILDKVEVKQVKVTDKLADALSSPSQLSNYRLVASFAKGEQILQSGLTLTVASVAVPKGYEAVPVQMTYVAGGAGYVAPGDYVNIYQVVPAPLTEVGTTPDAATSTVPYSAPRAELLLTKVLVLDINTQVAPLSTQQATTPTTSQVANRAAGGAEIVMLVAVNTVDAEKIIFGSQVQGLYLYVSKVDKDGNPSGPTAGQDFLTLLQQEANDAYAANPPK